MNRLSKKFLYGFIYLFAISLVGYFVFVGFLSLNPATCQDGILNQGEEQIDCGDPCQSCELKTLELDIKEMQVIEVGSKAALLVRFENPSINYGAIDIPYTFSYSDSSNIPKNIDGKFSVEPGEIGYILEPGLDLSSFPSASFKLGEFEFIESDKILVYQIGTRGISVEFKEEEIELKGVVLNDSPSDIKSLKIIILLKNTEDEIVNVTQTLIDGIRGFNRKDFLVRIPKGRDLIEPKRTEIFYEVLN